MIVLLPANIQARIENELNAAGKREVGGILMGEHVEDETFRIVDFTIQRHGGTFATFVRLVGEALVPLRRFFKVTGHDYQRFNYLGEWHSHHSFALSPSAADARAMWELIMDPNVGARFALLLLVRMNSSGKLEHNVTVYARNERPALGTVVQDNESPVATHD